MRSLFDLDLTGKRALVRVDFNIPIVDGRVTDDFRIKACLPTIKYLLKGGASIALISHLGRPIEGKFEEKYSLRPVAEVLSNLLKTKIGFETNWINGLDWGETRITLCENVRFLKGESTNSPDLSTRIAALCDVYVNDAFATAHRAHASTAGAVSLVDQSCAGPLLMAEIKALDRIINKTKKPIVAVVGGSKVSTKIDLLENLALKTDHLIVGGGIANSLLKAKGTYVGNSLVEEKSEETAKRLIQDYPNIILPEDVVCAKTFSKSASGKAKAIDAIEEDDQILDFGPNSLKQMSDLISSAETIIWNGPVGVFEFKNFETGTRTIGESIANSKAYSVAGGGDTVAAINKFKLRSKISYVSTAGGAFLEYLEGRNLPALMPLL